MNITAPHTTQLPANSSRVLARGQQKMSTQQSTVVQDAVRTPHAGRAVRINRASEDAALFAYNRQAQVHLGDNKAQIDEYV